MRDELNNLKELFVNLSETVEEHKNQTASELADLQSSIDSPPTTDEISDAVVLKLINYLNNMEQDLIDLIDESDSNLAGHFQDGLSSLSGSITDLRVMVGNLSDNVSNQDKALTDLNETASNLEDTLEKQTVALANLHERMDDSMNNLTGYLSGGLSIINGSITDLSNKVCNVSDTVSNMISNLEETVEEHEKQMKSELADLQEGIDEAAKGLAKDFHQGMSSLNSSVTDIRVKVCDLNETVVNLEETVEEHKSQTSSTLADLCEKVDDSLCGDFQNGLSSLNESVSALNELQINHENNVCSKLDSLDSKQDQLNMIVMSVASELEQSVLENVTKELQKTSDRLHRSLCNTCGGEGGWRRVVYLDMTDPTTSCPSGWQLGPYSKRSCGKVSSGSLTCDSAFFPVTGGEYTKVCGKIRGYQNSRTDAFEAYNNRRVTTIDGAYVSGVSLTHGSPREHIWTFAAGTSEAEPTYYDSCPCDATISIDIPPFVGGDYFCESGSNFRPPSGFYPEDPLWDGQGCTSSSTCCSFNNPPYFTKQLSSPTTDDIEARICQYSSSDDSPIELIELYVKGPNDGDGPCVSETDVIISKLDSVSAVLTEETRDELEEHVSHVNSELDELQINQGNINVKLDSLDSKQDQLNMKVMSVASKLEENILSNVTEELKQTSDSLHHSLGHICGGEGGWRRVVYLDMTDPTASCPSGWQLGPYPKRSCGRANSGTLTCDSAFFPVTGGSYTRVCGMIRGYQQGITDAFEAYNNGRVTIIDGAYVSGVSLTHGRPRQHIWTFAVGYREDRLTYYDSCPCDATISISIPPFVGGDYFCESGVNSGSYTGFNPDDPLWDGQGCTSSSTCCSMNSPPYFTKQLSSPTTDDIEARICMWESSDDSPIEFIELYVK